MLDDLKKEWNEGKWNRGRRKKNAEEMENEIATFDESALFSLWNDLCQKEYDGYTMADEIFYMSDFDEIIPPYGLNANYSFSKIPAPLTPAEWAEVFHNAYTFDYTGERTTLEEFNPHHDYFTIDGCNNLVSLPYIFSFWQWRDNKGKQPIDIKAIAKYITTNEEE